MHIHSPCLGLCSTTIGDLVCRGCMRHSDIITTWSHLSECEKREQVYALDAIINKVMPLSFIIEDTQKLVHTMTKASIPFDTFRSPYAWLHKYLVRTATTISIQELAQAGTVQRKKGEIFTLFQQCRSDMYQIATRLAQQTS